jgi:endoglucanase
MKPAFRRVVFALIPYFCVFMARALALETRPRANVLRINALEYFDEPGLSVLVFHNVYPEGHQGGVEIIQHGERIAACGDLRLEPTPGQWDPLPNPGHRSIDRAQGEISVPVHYPAPGIDYTIRVKTEGNAIRVSVDLEKSIPPEWAGRIGFNLELYPPAFFGKSFRLDGAFGVFPRQANGPVKTDSLGSVEPLPLACGKNVSIASEDPERRLLVSSDLPVMLYDGRITDQNGWFVLRTLVPEGATGNAVEWSIAPHVIPGWKRDPVIGFSQIGYHPSADKRAVIELDPAVRTPERAMLTRIEPDGRKIPVLSGTPARWGKFLRYEYAIFDFTGIKAPGLYRLTYGKTTTPPFPISEDVFSAGVWQPTLETFLPMQMCHVAVKDGFRTWHGVCHLDDALQAPVSYEHFDGYRQGAATETSYAPLEHVPQCNRGGWHDAGDDDLAAGAQAAAVRTLSLIRETFPESDTDQTTVLPEDRLVLCHRPDGIGDINQQIAHGVENLLSGYRAAGHSFIGIISNSIGQYAHCGDPSTATDNRIFDASLDSSAVSGDRSGRPDDRWVFTNRDASLEYQVAAALAASSRALARTHQQLSEECRATALRIWMSERGRPPAEFRAAYVPGNRDIQAVHAALELYISTRDTSYLNFIHENKPLILKRLDRIGWCLTRIWPDLDRAFSDSVLAGLGVYRKNLDKRLAENPYGIPFSSPTWGIGWNLQNYAMEQFFLIRAFPEIFPKENFFRALYWVFGCHPGSATSFISGVGARSLTAAYGFNRADGSYIPSGGASGTALIRPDFPELKEPFPFLWQQAEYVLSGAASYLFGVLAADALSKAGP